MKKINKEYINNIPYDIKVLFGKFFVFSIVYILLFSLIFPLIIIKYISFIFSIIFISLMLIIYLYMIFDVIKHKNKYNSSNFIILIVLVLTSILYSFIKIF